MLVSAVLTAFGLAVLYSASAFVADHEHHQSALLPRQAARRRRRRASSPSRSPPSSTPRSSASGRGRSCGSRSRRWSAVLVLPSSIAPTIHGSQALPVRRVVPAVGVRQARGRRLGVDADREEGRQPPATDQGPRAVPRRHRRARRARGARAGSLGRDAFHAAHGAACCSPAVRASATSSRSARCVCRSRCRRSRSGGTRCRASRRSSIRAARRRR